MGNPFKQDFIEARVNAKLSPEKVQAMMDAKSRIYTAKFIHAGVCGYRQQNDITYLSRDVLYRMADSYLGRPVVVGHDLNITPDNIEEKMKGTVVRCYTNDGDDWYVDFVVTDAKTVKKIDEEGYNYVSCAYIITEKADEPEVHDGLECTTVVVDGFYHHLAITNSPRYDDTEIWRINEDENIDLKKVGFSGIVNIESKENSNKENKTMFAFLKKEVPVDENLMFDTAAGRLNTSDLISKIDELVKENEDLKAQLNCSGKKADEDKDDKDDKDEDKENCSGKKNCSGKGNCSGKKNDEEKDEKEDCSDKKNDDKEKDKAKDDDKDSKENEESHEPGTAIPEAQAKANEEAIKSDVLKDAMPKVNEDERVAKVSVRGLSKLK